MRKFVFAIAVLDVNACRGRWYEPEQPKGLYDYVKKQKEKIIGEEIK